MQIGVLGGSFDPPHFGHLSVARQLLINHVVDEVWLVPCFSHAFEKKLASASDRLAMVKFLEEKNIKVSDFEINQPKTSYTIDTMDAFKKMYPGDDFFWILGSDQISVFPRYKNWQEIVRKHNLIIFPRESSHEKIISDVKTDMKLIGIPQTILVLNPKEYKINNVSSTEIRERVKRGKSISGLVPKSVEEYILKNKLYL